jgi:hypothetical protein
MVATNVFYYNKLLLPLALLVISYQFLHQQLQMLVLQYLQLDQFF